MLRKRVIDNQTKLDNLKYALDNLKYAYECQVGIINSRLDVIEEKLRGSEVFTKDLLKQLKLTTRRVEAVPAHGEIIKARKENK
jgi:hypothetical protein